MKSSSPVATPPLSPYGVFSGTLFQYSSSPSLIAFESLPPSAHINNDENISKKKCILIGGLSDGPIPTPYTKLLEEECHSLGWSLVQPVLSSSYLGFGHGSLSRDTCEIGKLLDYLVVHHDAEYFAFVGHSTGCQNSIHFLKHGDNDVDNNYIADAADTSSSSRIKRVKVVALQAPVSDRETDQDNSKYIQHAQQLVSQNQGDEMMPRSTFWAPITASRYISLFDKDGDDDFFSSDLTDEQLRERLGHVSREGGSSSELDVLAVYSGKDEYVPSFVDKNKLLKRMVDAMNDGGRCTNAKGLMLPNANHNLSKSEGDARTFVDAVSELLRKW